MTEPQDERSSDPGVPTWRWHARKSCPSYIALGETKGPWVTHISGLVTLISHSPSRLIKKWKLAAFHFSATSTKFSLTLLNAGKTNQGGKNGHFGVMQPSEMFPFSTKTKAESENQIHFAPQIARPWLAPSCWADPTLTHLCESSDPSVTVSSLEKPCFSWCISHTAF